MKINVVGAGYVGLANALVLSQKYDVVITDNVKEKVDLINEKKSPINEIDLIDFLKEKKLNLIASLDLDYNSDFIVIAVPTNYDFLTNKFNMEIVDSILLDINSKNCSSCVVIKSTIPIGYIDQQRIKYPNLEIMFSPEFLREGSTIKDNLYPTRIVVGSDSNNAVKFAQILQSVSLKEDVQVFFTNTKEAEAVKLFYNSYLAMRISFFNELDTFSQVNCMDTKQLLDCVCSDPRIGNFYNNPSFGYGGYCLPKDTKQLLDDFNGVPNSIIESIVSSNKIRKEFIAKHIISKKPKVVGIYGITMKSDSTNFRESAIVDIIKLITENGINVIIYDNVFKDNKFLNCEVYKDLSKFKKDSNIILANRFTSDLDSVCDKVYTRDIYLRD